MFSYYSMCSHTIECVRFLYMQLIDEEHWDVYDVYSVGLTLTRILFRPLWDADQVSLYRMRSLTIECVI